MIRRLMLAAALVAVPALVSVRPAVAQGTHADSMMKAKPESTKKVVHHHKKPVAKPAAKDTSKTAKPAAPKDTTKAK